MHTSLKEVETRTRSPFSPPNNPNPNLLLRQAVYTSLKETETRATDLLPYWKLPWVEYFVPRQQKAAEAVRIIREVRGVACGCVGGGGGGQGGALVDCGWGAPP